MIKKIYTLSMSAMLLIPSYANCAKAVFKNLSEKPLQVTIEYQSDQCKPYNFIIHNQETRPVDNGTCVITKITAKVVPQTARDKTRFWPSSEFEDHESGNAQYYFRIPQQQTVPVITKNMAS